MKPQKPRKISPALQKRLLRNLERLIQSGQYREGLRLLQEQQGVGSDTLQKIQKAISDGIRMGAWHAESHRRGMEMVEQWLSNADDEPAAGETQQALEPKKPRPELRTGSERAAIVHKFINSATDLRDREKVKALCGALDAAGIPVSQRKASKRHGLGGFPGPLPGTWMEVYSKPQSGQYKDRFDPRTSPLLKDLYRSKK